MPNGLADRGRLEVRWSCLPALADWNGGRHQGRRATAPRRGGTALTVGTSSGGRQSAIVIPVPDAEALVSPYRLEYDPVAAAGVPAHITLIVPWLPPDQIASVDMDELGEVLGGIGAFDFSLRQVNWFGRAVLWLAPDPIEPFVKLTATLAERFGTPPYEDEFDEVVPHLTVAHVTDGTGESVQAISVALARELPVACRAEQVWVMVGDGRRWWAHSKFDLPGS